MGFGGGYSWMCVVETAPSYITYLLIVKYSIYYTSIRIHDHTHSPAIKKPSHTIIKIICHCYYQLCLSIFLKDILAILANSHSKTS
jgi:hypothetical protein